MRRIEEEMVCAFNADRNWKKDNTEVRTEGGKTTVYLHGNRIAYKDRHGIHLDEKVCSMWTTVTTRSRLVALGFNARIRQGILYVDEQAIIG